MIDFILIETLSCNRESNRSLKSQQYITPRPQLSTHTSAMVGDILLSDWFFHHGWKWLIRLSAESIYIFLSIGSTQSELDSLFSHIGPLIFTQQREQWHTRKHVFFIYQIHPPVLSSPLTGEKPVYCHFFDSLWLRAARWLVNMIPNSLSIQPA